MPSILAANALTTLEVMLDDLSLTSDSGASQDQRVERCINAASDIIAAHCGRVFHHADDIEEKVAGYGTETIRLLRCPVVSIAGIEVSESAIDSAEYYVLNPDAGLVYRSVGWPWTAQRRPGITQPQVPGSEDASQIMVMYAGGYVTPKQAAEGLFSGASRSLPFDLEHVCIRVAASLWRSRGTDHRVGAESGQAQSTTFTGALPPDLLQILGPYRRTVTA